MRISSLKKISGKFICIILSLFLTVSLTACGGEGTGSSSDDQIFDGDNTGNANTTQIKLMCFGGGIGVQWLKNACVRFAEKVKDVSFEEGKKGVSFPDLASTTHIDLSTIKTSGYNIYWDENQANIQFMANAGEIMDITDIVTEKDENGKSIEDRIHPEYRGLTQYGGKYYALPHYSVYGGVAYDKDLFKKESLYIARTGMGESFTSFGKEIFFTGSPSEMSCGTDGVYGTIDDGLPTTFMEFIVMCAKMADQGVRPFSLAGNHTDYMNYLSTGLFGQMAGGDAMKANFTFDASVDAVTGYEDAPLLSNDNGLGLKLKKPVIESIDVTPATGYYTTYQVAKYYVAAFSEIAHRSDWFTANSYKGTSNHKTAQEDFIYSGTTIKNKQKEKVAMLIEGSHWWNEIRKEKIMEGYKNLTGKDERNVGYMILPSTFDEPVQEGHGRNYVFVDMTRTTMMINNNIKEEGLKKACKEFMKFIYSEDEMYKFTQATGVTRGVFDMIYDTSKPEYDGLHQVEKDIISCSQKPDTHRVIGYGDNDIYRNNSGKFLFALSCTPWSIQYNGNSYCTYLDGFRDSSLKSKTAQDFFEDSKINETKWNTEFNN